MDTEFTQVQPTDAESQETVTDTADQDENTAQSVETEKPNLDKEIGEVSGIRKTKQKLLAEVQALRKEKQELLKEPDAPNPADFQDEYGNINYAKYNEAQKVFMKSWTAFNDSQREFNTVTHEEEAEKQKLLNEFLEKSAEIPDYNQIAQQTLGLWRDDVNAELLSKGAVGAEIAAYLGRNKELLKKFNEMPYDQMVEAVDKLGNQFKEKKRTSSNAPSPVSPVDDSISYVNENISDEEYFRRENKKRLEDIKKKYQ